MRKAFEIGGFIAAAVLIAFGVVAIVMGVNGRQTVNNSLSHEYIVAGSDMTPSAIKAEAQKAGIYVGGQAVADDGHRRQDDRHRPRGAAMAQYMHIHALEATRWLHLRPDGSSTQRSPGRRQVPARGRGGTSNAEFAAIDPTTKQPVQNGAARLDQRDRAHELH